MLTDEKKKLLMAGLATMCTERQQEPQPQIDPGELVESVKRAIKRFNEKKEGKKA